jgi:hypothetical protein
MTGFLLLLLLVTPGSAQLLTRRERFPSIEERVKLYASNWYQPPCNDEHRFEFNWNNQNEVILDHNLTFASTIIPDQALVLQEDIIKDCARDEGDNRTLPTSQFIQFRQNMRMYCVDAVELMELVLHHAYVTKVPILVQFGDSKTSHIYGIVQLPHFKKFRSAAVSTKALEQVVKKSSSCQERMSLQTFHSDTILQPLVWKLATHRHYRHLPLVYRHDTPWDRKRPMAIFRGQLTGSVSNYDKHDDDIENCRRMKRCRLVYQHANSTLINAKLTTTRGRLPSTIHGVEIVGETITIREMMRYKAILLLEGNDVASGLKWALLSQSVVLMPKPRHTSWCMEELLQPWIHYVPLKDDLSDVETQMQWILHHSDEAWRISQRGTLWMEDMIFHPDAAREERLIKEELVRRYLAHFVEGGSKKPTSGRARQGGGGKKTQ